MARILLSFIAALLLSTPVWGQQDNQCGCDPETSFEAQFEAAEVILLGRCLRVSTNPIKGGLNVVFEVDSSWKRGIEHTATVHTNSMGQCGVGFEVGERYLVFAYKRHQTIETSICEWNFEAESMDAEKTMTLLGVGHAPGRPEMAWNMSVLILGLGIGGLLVMAFVVLRKKVFKPKA